MVKDIGSGQVKNMPSHLPVVATYSEDLSINLTSKGIGLLPCADRMEHFTSSFRGAIDKHCSMDSAITIQERLQVLLDLYSDPSNFNPSVLGGLEIFEGVTYQNLRRDPRVVLLFNGDAPDFVSYQVNGLARFVEKGDASYEYLLASRELFAHDKFHVPQSRYPHGFVVQVSSVKEKRPFSRR